MFLQAIICCLWLVEVSTKIDYDKKVRVTDIYGSEEKGTIVKTYEYGMFLRDREIQMPERKHEGTVICLHASVAHGASMRAWLDLIETNFTFPHLKILFPTAGEYPYTMFSGEIFSIWMDRKHCNPNESETIEVLRRSSEDLSQLIQDEVKSGIPLEKIIIGGFSQGGAMAMHMGYRFFPQVAGVFGLSSFLPYDSAVYKHLRKRKPERVPPLLLCTGDQDNFVSWKWVRDTRDKLKQLGVNTSFHVIPKASHRITILEINLLMRWINRLIPYKGE